MLVKIQKKHIGGNKLLKFKLENAIDIEEDIDGIVRNAKENF